MSIKAALTPEAWRDLQGPNERLHWYWRSVGDQTPPHSNYYNTH